MRRAGVVGVAVVLWTALSLVVVGRADAHTDVCGGRGFMVTQYPLYYPGRELLPSDPPIPLRVTTPFYLGWASDTNVCGTPGLGPAPYLVGTLVGQCGAAVGWGTDADGHDFAFVWAGEVVVFEGEVNGVGLLHPDWLAGDSCLLGADTFIVAGAFARCHGSVVTGTPGDTPLAFGYSMPPSIPVWACV